MSNNCNENSHSSPPHKKAAIDMNNLKEKCQFIFNKLKNKLLNLFITMADTLEAHSNKCSTRVALMICLYSVLIGSFMICLLRDKDMAYIFISNAISWLFVILILISSSFIIFKYLGKQISFMQTLHIGCLCSIALLLFFIPRLWLIVQTVAIMLFFATILRISKVDNPKQIALIAFPFIAVWICSTIFYEPYKNTSERQVNELESVYEPDRASSYRRKDIQPKKPTSISSSKHYLVDGDFPNISFYIDTIAPTLRPNDRTLLIEFESAVKNGHSSLIVNKLENLLILIENGSDNTRTIATILIDKMLFDWMVATYINESEISTEEAVELLKIQTMLLAINPSNKNKSIDRHLQLARYILNNLVSIHSDKLLLAADSFLQKGNGDKALDILNKLEQNSDVKEKIMLAQYIKEQPDDKEIDTQRIFEYFLNKAEQLVSEGKLRIAQETLRNLGDDPRALHQLRFVETLIENPLIAVDGNWIYHWSWSSPAAIVSDMIRQYKLRWKGYIVLYNWGDSPIKIETVSFRIIGNWEGVDGRTPTPPTFNKRDRLINPGETWKWEWDKTDATVGGAGLENFKLETTLVKYRIGEKTFEMAVDLQTPQLASDLRNSMAMLYGNNLSAAEKWNRFVEYRKSNKKDSVPLKFFRYFPIYDLNDKKLYSLDTYSKKQVIELGGEDVMKTNFGQDPLGCAYKMLFDTNYDSEMMKRDLGLDSLLDN